MLPACPGHSDRAIRDESDDDAMTWDELQARRGKLERGHCGDATAIRQWRCCGWRLSTSSVDPIRRPRYREALEHCERARGAARLRRLEVVPEGAGARRPWALSGRRRDDGGRAPRSQTFWRYAGGGEDSKRASTASARRESGVDRRGGRGAEAARGCRGCREEAGLAPEQAAPTRRRRPSLNATAESNPLRTFQSICKRPRARLLVLVRKSSGCAPGQPAASAAAQ